MTRGERLIKVGDSLVFREIYLGKVSKVITVVKQFAGLFVRISYGGGKTLTGATGTLNLLE